MMRITNNKISRYPLPGGGFYEYDLDLVAKILFGRIYDANGRRIATAGQAVWPWTKLLSPEEMFKKVSSKL